MMGGASRTTCTDAEVEARWAAACAAVERLLGAPPPVSRGPRAGGRRSNREEAWLRKVAVYTAHCGLGVGLTAMTAVAGPNRQTLSEIVRAMEALRDDTGVNELLDVIEGEALRQLARRAA